MKLEQVIECVPNFSEGRDASVLEALLGAIRSVPGAAVLDRTMDPDHNRSVITFAGERENVAEAAFRAVKVAAGRIDLTRHEGVHPRIGAADVVPFVPVRGVSLGECARIAEAVGRRIWDELRIPVYLYEAAARFPDRVRLENIRRGQFERLRAEVVADPARGPDIGGPEFHPTAGATVVGARKFLIAFNVNLASEDVAVAREIARAVRESSGGLQCVKALGLFLPTRGLAQVSMNLTDFERTPIHVAFEAVRREAERHGVEVAGSEVVGLIPASALENHDVGALRIENYSPELILENRLASEIEWK